MTSGRTSKITASMPSVTSEAVRVVEDVMCPFCGCLCDDIQITVEGETITKVLNGCAISSSKFRNSDRLTRRAYPTLRTGAGVTELGIDAALDRAAQILIEAKHPMLFGFAMTSTQTIRLGLELAEALGGVIDNTSSVCHGPGIIAQQLIGESTCTLGEVKNRADLIVYWGSNPVHAHPRHLRRYSAESQGRFRPGGRKERKVIVVDVRETQTAKKADYFLKIEPNSDFEVLNTLRMMLRDRAVPRGSVGGIPIERLREIVGVLKAAQMGVIFFGVGLTMSEGKLYNIWGVTQLTMDLNKYTKFNCIPMRGHYNVGGANKVFTWTTGYPLAVDFSRGYPRYSPTEYTGVQAVRRGEVDAMLVVASDPVAHFPRDAVNAMMKLPLITLDPHESLTASVSDLHFPTAMVGIEQEGTAYRMDSVPFHLKKIVEPPKEILSDAQVLEGILKRVKERQ